MDLKAFGSAIAQIGLPLLGAVLPIPGGAAIGTALAAAIGSPSATPEDILATLTGNADAIVKAKQFEQTHQETILRITTDAEIRAVEAVNKTMQSEAVSEHWPTYSWRPFIGFIAGTILLVDYAIAPLAKFPPIIVDPQSWLFLSAVLGIASYFRGKAQADPNVQIGNKG